MTDRRRLRHPPSSLFVCVLLALALGWTTSVLPAHAAERTFRLNYKKAFIDRLITQVAEETGRTIIFDEQVRGNISVITQREVTESEAWAILEASLAILGFSLLPSTVDNWRIAKVADAAGEAPFVEAAEDASESFVTVLIPLEAADLLGVVDVLEPISGGRVTLVPFEPTNSLIASGPERAIARLAEIANELDHVGELTLRYRVLRYRDVAEIEDLVDARVASMGDEARALEAWSDERTNSILFRGTEDDVVQLSRFLDRIDQPIESGGQIQVLRVLNRDPEEMATLISELAQLPSVGASSAEARAQGADLAGADYSIAVDKASRSLIVRAAPSVQRAIRQLLEELDDPPQLIAVDLTISELRTPRSRALGFAFSIPLAAGQSSEDLVARLFSEPVAGATLARIPGETTTIYGRVARDTGVAISGPPDAGGSPTIIPIDDTGVIEGGEFNVRTEVLIQPHLIVASGEEHEIFVGMNVPVPVTEGGIGDVDANSVTGVRLSRTTRFDRTDIGIRLGIGAKAGRKGKIQLDLDLELSTLINSIAGSIETVGPSFLEETLTARARLDHGQTAIIGLNRRKKTTQVKSGVPWLSAIPFLGWIFSAEAESDEDVNLVIAAKARRVSSPAALVADTIRRRLAFQRQNARNGVLPGSPEMPFAVRVTTRERAEDAEAIAEGLALAGHETTIHRWTHDNRQYLDVYVVSLESMADAAEIASALTADGWDPDLVLLSTRS